MEMEEKPFVYFIPFFFRASVQIFQGMSWPDSILFISKPLRGKILKLLFWPCLYQQSWVIDWSFGPSWTKGVVFTGSEDKQLDMGSLSPYSQIKDLEPPPKERMDAAHEDFL